MIRALRKWWLTKQIIGAEIDQAYYASGVEPAMQRAKEYRAKARKAAARAYLLRLKRNEVDYPINKRGMA